MTASLSNPTTAMRPLNAAPGTLPDAAVARLIIRDDNTASYCLMAGKHVLAQVTGIPSEPAPPLDQSIVHLLPPALRLPAARTVLGSDLEQSQHVLTLLCLYDGLDAPALTMVRRMMGMPAARFARWIGVTPETLSRWEQGHRPVNPMARRSLLMAFRAMVAPIDGRAAILANLPPPPSSLTHEPLSISLQDGVRWLEQLALSGSQENTDSDGAPALRSDAVTPA